MNGRWLGSAGLLVLVACNTTPRADTTGTTIDNAVAGTDRGPALTIVTAFAADGRCPQGGQELRSGFDDDDDGQLAEDELAATTVLCGAIDAGPPLEPPAGEDAGLCESALAAPSAPALALDVEGAGYFVLAGPDDETRLYTRALDLHVGDTGELRDAHGLRVLGRTRDDGPLAPLAAAPPVRTARATSAVQLALNLASDAALSPPWTGASPRGESSFSTELVVFDSGGAARRVSLYFARIDARRYAWHAVIDASELADPGGYEAASGELWFDAEGRLITGDVGALNVSFLGAAPDQRVRIDFTGSTSLLRASALTGTSQDGHGAGAIAGYDVGSTGDVLVRYTSGSPQSLGRLVLAALQPDADVSRACQGLWLSRGAVPAGVTLGAPGAAGLGRVRSLGATAAP